jgi:hypothetical protein
VEEREERKEGEREEREEREEGEREEGRVEYPLWQSGFPSPHILSGRLTRMSLMLMRRGWPLFQRLGTETLPGVSGSALRHSLSLDILP